MRLFDILCAAHWAMEPTTFDAMRAILERHAEGTHLKADEIRAAIGRAPGTPNPKAREYDVHMGIALIPVTGVLSKHAAGVNDISAPPGVSAEEIQNNLRTALADGGVQAILICIESPGGDADGMLATKDVIRMAAAQKPLWAFVDGLAASAAYAMALGAAKIIATPSSRIGSIGILSALRDTSKADEKAGYKTIVLRSGPHKAPGQRGEAITDEQLKPLQDTVDAMAQQFYDAVSAERGLSGDALAAVTDGRTFLAEQAMKLGLIDAVGTYEQVLADLSTPQKRAITPIGPRMHQGRALSASVTTNAGGRPAAGGHAMQLAPTALDKLISANPAHADMISAMATGRGGATPATEADILAAIQVKDTHNLKAEVERLTAELKTAQGDLVKAKAESADAATKLEAKITAMTADLAAKDGEIANLKKGNPGIQTDPKALEGQSGSAAAAYQAKVAELKKAGDKDPFRTIAAQHRDLHEAYLAEANGGAQVKAAGKGGVK